MKKTASVSSSVSVDRFLFLLVFLSGAYFFQGGRDAVNSRFDTGLALGMQSTLAINAFHTNTRDKFLVGMSYFSSEAPGPAMLTAPLTFFLRFVGLESVLRSPGVASVALYLATLLTVGLLTALASVAFRHLLCLLNPGLSGARSVGFTVLVYLGSGLFPGATWLSPETLCAALLVLGTAAMIPSGGKPLSFRRAMAGGLAWGLSPLCAFASVLLVVPLAVFCFTRAQRKAAWSAAIPAMAVPVLIYLGLCVASGLPIERAFGWVSLPALGSGGWLFALPFFALGLAYVPERPILHHGLTALAVAFIGWNLALTATSPFLGDSVALTEGTPGRLPASRISVNPVGFLTDQGEWKARWIHPELHTRVTRNAGELVGLYGAWSILPLLVGWLAAFFWGRRRVR